MTTLTESKPPGLKEIAGVAAFPAADESYITGQIWAVDGGFDM